MSKTNDTKKIRELTEDHRPLADSELDAVSGAIADYVKQLLQTQSPLARSDARKVVPSVYDYDGGKIMSKTNDLRPAALESRPARG
jgi:hypothetical protein